MIWPTYTICLGILILIISAYHKFKLKVCTYIYIPKNAFKDFYIQNNNVNMKL